MSARACMLLVEDDPADIYMFRRVMDPHLKGRLHCEESARHVSAAIANHKPDFIVTDLNLPGADGVSVVQAVRRGEGWRDLPVIVCSTSNEPGDVARAYKAGANAYVRKPSALDDWTELAWCLICFWGELNLRPA